MPLDKTSSGLPSVALKFVEPGEPLDDDECGLVCTPVDPDDSDNNSGQYAFETIIRRHKLGTKKGAQSLDDTGSLQQQI